MVNLRSRSKARAVAPRAALKVEPTILTPSMSSDNSNLSEAALRKLPRSELQKLAMAHKVKANMKSELIIQQLSNLQMHKKTRPAEDDPQVGPSRKRFKREATSEEVLILPTSDNRAAPLGAQPSQDAPVRISTEEPQLLEAGPSAPVSIPPAQNGPTILSYDEDLFSGTESEMTEEEQLDFATPVSSRSETPPPANVNDLNRCVRIMQEISAQDVTLLNEVEGAREIAAKLRRRARGIRDLVKAESGRRERMEAYFRYWRETEPRWDRQWLYGEKIQPNESDKPDRQYAQGARNSGGRARSVTPDLTQKSVLSPEQLKLKRDAIISKQEAEQRQLQALWRREMRGENSSSEGSSQAADERSPDVADLPDKNDVNEPPLVSLENSIGTMVVPGPSS